MGTVLLWLAISVESLRGLLAGNHMVFSLDYPVALADRYRFPPVDMTRDMYALSSLHISWLEYQRDHDWKANECYWKERIGEADHLRWVWSRLLSSHTDFAMGDGETAGEDVWDYRLHHLECLRGLVGVGAYNRGEMPPCVPIWRFQRK